MGMLATIVRYTAVMLAAAILLGDGPRQPVAATMNDAPDVTTYAVTHICGTHVCGH